MLAHETSVDAVEVAARTQYVSVVVESETVGSLAESFAAQLDVIRLRGTTGSAAEIGFGVESDDGFAFEFLLKLAGRTTVSFAALQTARLSRQTGSIFAVPYQFPETRSVS